MIGKNFRVFSNDWKTFSGEVFARTMATNSDHFGKETTRTTWDNFFSRCAAQPGGGWERGRPARGAPGKRKTSEKANVFCNLTSKRYGWKPHLRKSRAASPEGHAPLPGVRHLAALLRMESGRGEKDKQDKGGQSCGKGGEREAGGRTIQRDGNLDNSSVGGAREGWGRDFSRKGHKGHKEGGKESGRGVGGGNLQECLECRCADLNGLEGEGIYIEKHENRFADIERDWGWARVPQGHLETGVLLRRSVPLIPAPFHFNAGKAFSPNRQKDLFYSERQGCHMR